MIRVYVILLWNNFKSIFYVLSQVSHKYEPMCVIKVWDLFAKRVYTFMVFLLVVNLKTNIKFKISVNPYLRFLFSGTSTN